MNNKQFLSIKDILEIEKKLDNDNINVDTYLDYFFKINIACSTGLAKEPLRLYLALRNANVTVSANDKDNQIKVYDNVVNTVNYLISNYAKAYINENNNLEKHSENLQATMLQNDFITFEMFKKCYKFDELNILDFRVSINDYLSDTFVKYILELFGNKTQLKNIKLALFKYLV